MTHCSPFETINEAKAKMGHIYDEPDPRAYFRELRKLGYAIPDAAKPIFQRLISRLRKCRNEKIHILDLGCSYGVNAAILKYDLSMSDLYEHWTQERLSGAAPEEVTAYDQHFFTSLEESQDFEIIGLDQAENAVRFAEATGLLDEGLALNLESEPLPAPTKGELVSIDLVTSTGCIGYITEQSFDQLLPVVTRGQAPWFANFVLRLFPFDTIEANLGNWGYVTEKLEGYTFIQRRFASADERKDVLGQLRELGVDPEGKEAEGHLLAEFFLSRPTDEAAELPIEQLLAA